MIDLAGIGNLLEYLVAADNITCEERDRIILLDLLDIPLNRYKERLSNRIETINCWWADRCDQ